jgi:NAD(P)-dependent dehydrogenase (short-subunit alcohol dehydrogenase family)
VDKQTDRAGQTAQPRLLDGKVALVTGGGRGLGREICSMLAGAGAAVVVADIHRELAEKVARELGYDGANVLALTIDVSDEASVARALDEVREHLGRVDILVNNAGTDQTLSLEEIGVEQWTQVLDVNLVGQFLTTRGVFPTMRESGGAHIVTTTSTAAKRAWADASAYHAGEWGLLGFSHAARHAAHVEGRPHDIKVTALVSGGMRTPFPPDRVPDIDLSTPQDVREAAETVFVVTRPRDAVIPELVVLPIGETSWP